MDKFRGSPEDELVHRLKNQLSIILGFTELLLEDMAEQDPKRKDLNEIRTAAHVALDQLPELTRRLHRQA